MFVVAVEPSEWTKTPPPPSGQDKKKKKKKKKKKRNLPAKV